MRAHSQLFWKNLAPSGSPQTKFDSYSTFKNQVEKDFGSFENLKNEVNTKTAAVQGSGWGWLGFNKASKRLEVVTTANQDPLLSMSSLPSCHLVTRQRERRELTR
jgi:Fe-Mn family superoxide dismutase